MIRAIIDIPITFDRREVAGKVERMLTENQAGAVATINANIVVNADKNEAYKEILKKNAFNICDGALLAKSMSKIYDEQLMPYPGPDFFMDRIREKKYKSHFLGSTQSVLDMLKAKLLTIDPRIADMEFVELPFCKEAKDFDYEGIAKEINAENPDFIWVSLGAPKQEQFANILEGYLDRGLIVAVGAAFDFYSGNVKRAPMAIRWMKIEWLWRLISQPSKTGKRLKNELLGMPGILMKENKRQKNRK